MPARQQKNGDLGLVWMMVQVYPVMKNKICDICVLVCLYFHFVMTFYHCLFFVISIY